MYTQFAVAKSIASCKLVVFSKPNSSYVVESLRATVEVDCDNAAMNNCAVSGITTIEKVCPTNITHPSRTCPLANAFVQAVQARYNR